MDAATSSLATSIGARVRKERQARGWTLDQLANLSDLSRRMVINVEQGTANPSVGTLLRLSDALGMGLPALVETPEPAAVKVTRAGTGAVLWTGDNGGRGVLVAGTDSPDVVELWDWTLEPGEVHRAEAHAGGTKELLMVDAGTVTLDIAGETFVLGKGDAISFPGDVPHGYANAGKRAARFRLSVFEPDVGGRP